MRRWTPGRTTAQREFVARRAALGFCKQCGTKSREAGRTRCLRCLASAKKYKNRKISEGFCSMCITRRPEAGYKICSRCRSLSLVRHRRRSYKVSQTGYNEMYVTQNGLCAICKEPSRLGIDHDHKSGLVRSLLCRRCNFLLGLACDNTTILLEAVEYLRHNEEKICETA